MFDDRWWNYVVVGQRGKAMRWIVTVVAAVVLVDPVGAQTYDERAAMVEGPWHHVPNPVSKLQLERDDGRCRGVTAQTPVKIIVNEVPRFE